MELYLQVNIWLQGLAIIAYLILAVTKPEGYEHRVEGSTYPYRIIISALWLVWAVNILNSIPKQ